MTYFYNHEDLPEVVTEEGGTYLIEGRRFQPKDVNTEEHIKNEIDLRLALLHQVQAENDAAQDIYDYLDSLSGEDEYDDDEFDAPGPIDEVEEAAVALFRSIFNAFARVF